MAAPQVWDSDLKKYVDAGAGPELKVGGEKTARTLIKRDGSQGFLREDAPDIVKSGVTIGAGGTSTKPIVAPSTSEAPQTAMESLYAQLAETQARVAEQKAMNDRIIQSTGAANERAATTAAEQTARERGFGLEQVASGETRGIGGEARAAAANVADGSAFKTQDTVSQMKLRQTDKKETAQQKLERYNNARAQAAGMQGFRATGKTEEERLMQKSEASTDPTAKAYYAQKAIEAGEKSGAKLRAENLKEQEAEVNRTLKAAFGDDIPDDIKITMDPITGKLVASPEDIERNVVVRAREALDKQKQRATDDYNEQYNKQRQLILANEPDPTNPSPQTLRQLASLSRERVKFTKRLDEDIADKMEETYINEEQRQLDIIAKAEQQFTPEAILKRERADAITKGINDIMDATGMNADEATRAYQDSFNKTGNSAQLTAAATRVMGMMSGGDATGIIPAVLQMDGVQTMADVGKVLDAAMPTELKDSLLEDYYVNVKGVDPALYAKKEATKSKGERRQDFRNGNIDFDGASLLLDEMYADGDFEKGIRDIEVALPNITDEKTKKLLLANKRTFESNVEKTKDTEVDMYDKARGTFASLPSEFQQQVQPLIDAQDKDQRALQMQNIYDLWSQGYTPADIKKLQERGIRPGVIKGAFADILGRVGEKYRTDAEIELAQDIENGNFTKAVDDSYHFALRDMPDAQRSAIRSRKVAIASMEKLKSEIADYEAEGGDMGFFTGKWDKITSAVQKTTDPKRKALFNFAQDVRLAYQHSITGAQMSDKEREFFEQLFPENGDSASLATAKLDGLLESANLRQRTEVGDVIGEQAFETLNAISTYFDPEMPQPVKDAVYANYKDVIDLATKREKKPSTVRTRGKEDIVEFISGEEGFRSVAYQDSAGVWTVGHGLTTINGVPVKEGDTITEEASRSAMNSHISHIADNINENFDGLNKNQRDALTSFMYNLGTTPANSEALFDAIRNGDMETIKSEWLMFNKARDPKTGELVPLKGLSARRARELELFLSDMTLETTKDVAAEISPSDIQEEIIASDETMDIYDIIDTAAAKKGNVTSTPFKIGTSDSGVQSLVDKEAGGKFLGGFFAGEEIGKAAGTFLGSGTMIDDARKSFDTKADIIRKGLSSGKINQEEADALFAEAHTELTDSLNAASSEMDNIEWDRVAADAARAAVQVGSTFIGGGVLTKLAGASRIGAVALGAAEGSMLGAATGALDVGLGSYAGGETGEQALDSAGQAAIIGAAIGAPLGGVTGMFAKKMTGPVNKLFTAAEKNSGKPFVEALVDAEGYAKPNALRRLYAWMSGSKIPNEQFIRREITKAPELSKTFQQYVREAEEIAQEGKGVSIMKDGTLVQAKTPTRQLADEVATKNTAFRESADMVGEEIRAEVQKVGKEMANATTEQIDNIDRDLLKYMDELGYEVEMGDGAAEKTWNELQKRSASGERLSAEEMLQKEAAYGEMIKAATEGNIRVIPKEGVVQGSALAPQQVRKTLAAVDVFKQNPTNENAYNMINLIRETQNFARHSTGVTPLTARHQALIKNLQEMLPGSLRKKQGEYHELLNLIETYDTLTAKGLAQNNVVPALTGDGAEADAYRILLNKYAPGSKLGTKAQLAKLAEETAFDDMVKSDYSGALDQLSHGISTSAVWGPQAALAGGLRGTSKLTSPMLKMSGAEGYSPTTRAIELSKQAAKGKFKPNTGIIPNK